MPHKSNERGKAISDRRGSLVLPEEAVAADAEAPTGSPLDGVIEELAALVEIAPSNKQSRIQAVLEELKAIAIDAPSDKKPVKEVEEIPEEELDLEAL